MRLALMRNIKVKKDTNVETTRLISCWETCFNAREVSLHEQLHDATRSTRDSTNSLQPLGEEQMGATTGEDNRQQLDNGIDRTEQNSIGQVGIGMYIPMYVQDLEHSLSLSYYGVGSAARKAFFQGCVQSMSVQSMNYSYGDQNSAKTPGPIGK